MQSLKLATNGIPRDMSEAEYDMRQVIYGLLLRIPKGRSCPPVEEGHLGRDICVTPYEGVYNEPAGAVIAIRGTPPRGTLLVLFSTRAIVFFDNWRARVVKDPEDRYWGYIRRFLIERDISSHYLEYP